MSSMRVLLFGILGVFVAVFCFYVLFVLPDISVGETGVESGSKFESVLRSAVSHWLGKIFVVTFALSAYVYGISRSFGSSGVEQTTAQNGRDTQEEGEDTQQ